VSSFAEMLMLVYRRDDMETVSAPLHSGGARIALK
jgi:hypothetical protein